MKLSWPDGSASLFVELRWLNRLRWLAGLLVMSLGLTGLWWSSLGIAERWGDIFAVGVAIISYNAALWAVCRFRKEWLSRRSVALLVASSGVLLDLGCLALLSAWTGGLHSPLVALFVLHVVFVSLLLPGRASYVSVAISFGLLAAGLWLTGNWPASSQDGVLLGSWVATLLLVAFVADHITTSMRRHETALVQQQRRNQAILDTASDGIITTDRHGIIVSANPAADDIFEYEPGSLPGRNVSILMDEPDRSQHTQYMDDYIRTGQSEIIGIGREIQGLRSDGTTIPLHVAVSPVPLGTELLFTAILRDMSERRQAQAKMKHLGAKLRRQQEALAQQEKMAAMGQIAAGVAHEVSNPLASMDSLLQLLTRRPEEMGPKTIDTLRLQIDRISRILRQMTDFAHPDETGTETVALNDLVEQALTFVSFDHRLRQVEFSREFSPEVGNVNVNRLSFQQVMVNLIQNSLDALAKSESPSLSVQTIRSGDKNLIKIADNGEGIESKNLGRIFEPFFTTKPVGRGTGLGLSISYRLIEKCSGHISVESTVGLGTTFTITLPSNNEGSTMREPNAEPVPDSGNTEN